MGWENDKQVPFRCLGNTVWGGLSSRCRWRLAGHGSKEAQWYAVGDIEGRAVQEIEHWLGSWEEGVTGDHRKGLSGVGHREAPTVTGAVVMNGEVEARPCVGRGGENVLAVSIEQCGRGGST